MKNCHVFFLHPGFHHLKEKEVLKYLNKFIVRHQELYERLKNKDPKELSSLEKDLLRDWGNPDIFGPWTELEENSHWDPSVGFKFYKYYYLIDFGDKPAQIDTFPVFQQPFKKEKESLGERMTKRWQKLEEIFKNRNKQL
jgi:hypothetical protein